MTLQRPATVRDQDLSQRQHLRMQAQSPMARSEIHPQGSRSKHLFEMSDEHIEAKEAKRWDDNVCNQQHPLAGELSAASLSEDPASASRWCCGRQLPWMKVHVLPIRGGHSLEDPLVVQQAEPSWPPSRQPSSSDTQQPELQQALSDLLGELHPSSAQSLQKASRQTWTPRKDAVFCKQGSRCLMSSRRTRTAAEMHFGCIALGVMEGAATLQWWRMVEDAAQLYAPSS